MSRRKFVLGRLRVSWLHQYNIIGYVLYTSIAARAKAVGESMPSGTCPPMPTFVFPALFHLCIILCGTEGLPEFQLFQMILSLHGGEKVLTAADDFVICILTQYHCAIIERFEDQVKSNCDQRSDEGPKPARIYYCERFGVYGNMHNLPVYPVIPGERVFNDRWS